MKSSPVLTCTMMKLISHGVLFLAALALIMGVYGLAQPTVAARHVGLVALGASAFAAFITWALATHWATFQRFSGE